MKIKNSFKVLGKIAAVLLGMTVAGSAFATTGALALSNIQSNIGSGVSNLSIILGDVSLVAGIGFVMASFFKFHQHKLNPTQVPLSQGITLLLIGAGLLLFPVMLPTATKAAFGTTSIGNISGGAITGLVGS